MLRGSGRLGEPLVVVGLSLEEMDPRRAWDPRMDPRAGRGDGQQQLPGQQQQQAWEVPWQDQVRGNPQAA